MSRSKLDQAPGFVGWLDARLGFSAALDFLRHKPVPHHRSSVWYYFGGVSLFLFSVQVTTGLLLLIYYKPTPDAAFESVRFIMAQVPFGWLIRSLHSWSANLMVLSAFVHMFSVYFMKAYRPPRELTWMTGMGLLGLTLAFGFSGYLLPWNELALFATKVGTDIVGSVPGIGHTLLRYVRGGEDVGGATLTRFFGWHVALLPAVFSGLLGVHLLLVQRLGMSEPLAIKTAPRTIPFFPGFIIRDAILWLGVLGVLLALCTFLPWELGMKADPFAPAPAGIRPEWYFTFLSQSLKYIPSRVLGIEGEIVGITASGLGGLFFLLVPFLDRRAARGQSSPIFTAIGIGVLLYMATMTTLAYVKPY
ncbi:MAG TPA: cytochrome bc complex cytochrome b subunit [Candidatus Binatia bacterium]|nr:cytochrome bc complex cytochrome b subunit [Candidatus Binatia bacterium]